MCLIAFAWNVHPRWPLVLCANRDEFYERPTATLARWDDAPDIVGGRDLRAGGGWLALASGSRLAAVTNVREGILERAARSRGALVQGFLEAGLSAAAYAEQLLTTANDYSPFNLLLWDGLDLIHVSNRPAPAWASITAGVHGVSNGTLNSPWPKTRKLNRQLQRWLDALPADEQSVDKQTADTQTPDTTPLFDALSDRDQAPDTELPDTGIGLSHERLLSPAFIAVPGYGTRASTVVLVGRDGQALIEERSFDASGRFNKERRLHANLLSRPLQLSE